MIIINGVFVSSLPNLFQGITSLGI